MTSSGVIWPPSMASSSSAKRRQLAMISMSVSACWSCMSSSWRIASWRASVASLSAYSCLGCRASFWLVAVSTLLESAEATRFVSLSRPWPERLDIGR